MINGEEDVEDVVLCVKDADDDSDDADKNDRLVAARHAILLRDAARAAEVTRDDSIVTMERERDLLENVCSVCSCVVTRHL